MKIDVLNLCKVVFIITFVVLLAVTIFLIIRGRKKIKQCDECVGTIVGIREYTSGPFVDAGEKGVSPVVSYIVDGRNYEFEGNYYSTRMKVGDTVKLLYNREDYSKAMIKTGIFVAPIITGSLAVLFLLLGVGFVVV